MSVTLTFEMPESFVAKIAGTEVQFEPARMNAGLLAYVMEYGITRAVNDRANRMKADAGGKWTGEDSRRLRDALYNGTLRGRAEKDPVTVEVLKLGEAALLRHAFKVETRAAAAKHPKFGAYFTVSAKGGISPNVGAILAFVKKNPDLGIRERAEEIVAQRDAPLGEDVSVDF